LLSATSEEKNEPLETILTYQLVSKNGKVCYAINLYFPKISEGEEILRYFDDLFGNPPLIKVRGTRKDITDF